MSLPIIFPAEGQPIWALMQELEALGGVRHQDFKVVSGMERSGYQVTPELYQKWLDAGGVDTSGEHSNPEPTADPDAAPNDGDGEAGENATEDGGAAPDTRTDTEAEADKNAALSAPEDAAQESGEEAPKTATSKRGARGNR